MTGCPKENSKELLSFRKRVRQENLLFLLMKKKLGAESIDETTIFWFTMNYRTSLYVKKKTSQAIFSSISKRISKIAIFRVGYELCSFISSNSICHSSMKTALVKKIPKVWKSPLFKAFKNVNFFYFK